jgi:DNA-binding NtrC family response regulator/tetratricopeptide (TPR) repeat protein
MKSNEEERLVLAHPSTTTGSAEQARCFGRDHELAELVELVDGAVRDDLGRVVLLSGDPGIGKSRLVAALSAELSARGLVVLAGRCRDGVHHAATYRPFVEVVDGAIAALEAAGERGVAERGREVREALDGRAVPGALGTAWVERRAALFDAVTGFLVDASRLIRLAILVHDLDAADRATRELCAHLGTIGAPADALASPVKGARLRGALVLTGRELDATLVPGAAATTVELRALDQDGVRAFLQSPEVVAFFAEATGGRPRALEALLESMPLDADQLLRARWQRLSAAAQRLAGALAVAGRPTGIVELGALAEVDSLELARAVQELEAGRVVRREIVRGEILLSYFRRGDEEAIYALVADAERAALHLRAGLRLASEGREDLDDLRWRVRVAEHLLRGGAGAAAVESALRAAEALEATYGYDRAIDLLRRASSAAAALADDDTVAAIDDRLCELERAVGDYDAALATAQRLQARRPAAAAARRVAALLVLRDELEPGLAALDAAEALAADDAAERARIAAARAEALLSAGRTGEAKLAAEAALAHTGDAEAATRRLEVQNTLGKIALAESRYADAATLFAENVAPARAIGSAFEESRALFNLGIAELRVGDHASAQARYRLALEIAERAADHRNRAFCLQNLGVLSHWRGDYADALASFQAAVSAFRRTGLRARLAWVALDLASVYLDLGDVAAAEATAALVEQLGAPGMPPKIAIDRALIAARIAALGGRPAEARAQAAFVQRSAAGHQPERVVEAGQLLVRLELDDGDAEAAEHTLERLPRSHSDRTQLRSDLLRGELHLLRGRGLEARRLLRDALATAQRIADLDCEWRSQFLLGRAAEALRDGAEADRRFRAALATDRRLRDRVPEAQRAAFEALPLRRALERACGLPVVVPLPLSPRPQPRLVEAGAPLSASPSDQAAPLVGRLIGSHPRMRQVAALVERAAPAESIVLIRGESGTGKELVAEALHEGSPRRGRPFVKVNCGAIVESLLLSELFGHERGAFTGAMQRKKGRFEVADGGTIFLDEIGDISPGTQVALLRVLQERQFERVGGTTPVRVDVRILCATHRNLEEMVGRGEFREDLYYRLRGIQIELPPLRERPSDIAPIAQAILADMTAQRGARPLRLTADALQLLGRHSWPGNVRELENVLRSASVFADGAEIDARDVGELVAPREARVELAAVSSLAAAPPAQPAEAAWHRLVSERLSLKELKTRVEIECIERALAASNGNITRAAEKLGMKRPRLSQLIKEHGLRAELHSPDHDSDHEDHPDAEQASQEIR